MPDPRDPWIRVGLLIPSSNTVMEVDFYRGLPSGVTLHTSRMYMESTTPEGEAIMLDRHTLPAARDVGTAKPDVVVFGCTSAGALRGNDYESHLCRRIEQESGAPVISVISSVRQAIRERSVARVGVLTPYVDSLNAKIKTSLEADGVEVVAMRGLGITENFAIAEVEPGHIAAVAAETFEDVDLDLVFVSCTNLRAMDAITLIEQRLEIPVLTSNQTALEATLTAIGRGSGAGLAAPSTLTPSATAPGA